MTPRCSVGDALEDVEFLVSVAPMKIFSILMEDPNPIHYDPAFVAGLGLGDRPVNQGTITMGYVVNAVIAWAGGVERLLSFRCRFVGNVVDGDRVVVGGRVTSLQTEDRGPVAELELWLTREGGQTAVTATARVLVG